LWQHEISIIGYNKDSYWSRPNTYTHVNPVMDGNNIYEIMGSN